MGRQLVNKIRGMNLSAAKGVLLFWAFLFSLVCAFGLQEASAAPTINNAWTSVYAATQAAASINVTSSSFTANAGSNRLMLVAVHMEIGTGNTTISSMAVTYGGVTVVPIGTTGATSGRMHTWLGYLTDAMIPAGAQTVNVQATSAANTITGAQIKVATYTGVDQSSPVSASTQAYAGAAVVALPGALSYVADSISVIATANGGTAPTLTLNRTGGVAFATQTAASSTAGGFGGFVTVSGTNATAGSYTTATNATYAGTTSTRSSLVAASIRPWTASSDVTKPTVTSFVVPSSSSSATISGITFTASDDVGVTGYLINESATPPAPATITSPTAPTSYTVATGGTKVLYAWVKDAAGNVNNVYTSQTCLVTLPTPPTRTANWTSQYAAVAYPAGTVSNYTAAAGTNRLLVVAIASTRTTVGTQSVTNVTWGGKPLTLAAGNGSLATIYNHTWLYYLKESDIASATGNALTVTITGGTAYYTRVYASVYTGVDQATPITSTALFETATLNTALGPFSPTLTVAPYHQAVQIVNLARNTVGTTGRTVSAWAAGWTTAGQAPTGIVTSGPCQQVYVRDRAVPTVLVNDGSQHTTSSANAFDSMAAMTIKPSAAGVNLTTGTTVANKTVYAGDTAVAVDAFTLQTVAADTVTSIQVTGNAATNNTNVSALRIYRKVGSNGAIYEAGDVEIANVANPFSGGSVANVPVAEPVSGAQSYVIVYDIAATASPSSTNTLTGNVTSITVTNPGSISDPVASSATITINATTTIGDGVEPAAVRLYMGSAATMLDAFTLSHNSAQASDNDTFSSMTVVLSPIGISGSGSELSKIAEVAVVNAANTVVYGMLTAPTTGDNWNVPLSGLVATATPADYFIRIKTASNILPGFYTVSARIASVIHSKTGSRLVNNDLTSQAQVIDIEEPSGPTMVTATTSAQQGGKIDLVWDEALDNNGGALHATTPYQLVRSQAGGTAPNDYCVLRAGDTLINPGNVTSYTDTGLNDTQAPIYHYRICAVDTLGNVSNGVSASAASSYTNYCDQAPDVTLGSEDPLVPGAIQDQLIKSEGGAPFSLQITNRDIGNCPNVTFNIALVDTTTVGGSGPPAPSVADFSTTFPASVVLGKTAGAGGTNKTSSTESIFIHGLPTADQIQKYIFKAQVSATGHPTVTTAAATGILNDMPPIVHNANNMAKYQYGTWGNTYTCATCHSNSTTNIKGIYQVISTPIGRRNVVFTKTSSSSSDADGVYGNDQRALKNVSNNVCSVCHHRTRQHQYSANKPFGGPNNDVVYTSDHHNSRDCVKCHTHNTAFRSILGVCGDCHGFKGTQYSPINKATMVKQLTNALGTNPPSYGAHLRHNIAKMSCATCHNNTNHGLSASYWVGDEALEIGFQIDNSTFPGFNPATPITGGTFNGTNNLNAPYVWVPGPGTTINTVADYNSTCSVYCHGDWQDNSGSNRFPNWVGAGQATCGTCHNATGAAPPQSGSHEKHAGTGAVGLGIACVKCHSTYTNYTGSAHINGNVQWNLSQVAANAYYNGVNAGSTNQPAPTNTASYGACTNLYCHSNVQGANGIGAPSYYATPVWGDNGAESTTASCGSCHQYPNKVGGHEQHESAEFAFDCHVCHNTGGTTAPLNHANGKVDFRFVGLGEGTQYKNISSGSLNPGLGYGTCSTSNCHGRYTRSWGPPSELSLCDKCHGSRTSARGFYSTRGPDGTLSVYSAGIGTHDIHVRNNNSPRKTAFNRFTSFSVGFNCNQCHYNPTGPFSAGHIDTAIPAEVPFAHMSSIGHVGVDSFGYSSYSTPKFTAATQTCSSVWCHGAGMQSNNSKGPYAGVAPAIQRQNPKWNVPFLQGKTAMEQCTSCHAMPPPPKDSSSPHYNITLAQCVGCHQHLTTNGLGFANKSLHINGRIDGGCTGCHGNPPVDTGIGTATGLVSPATNALRLGTAGAHNAHKNNPNIGTNCATCHYSYNPVMTSTGVELEIGFNGFNGKVVSGTFTGYTNSVNGPKWKANSAPGGTTTIIKVDGVNDAANECASVYCHGGGTATLAPLGGGTLTNPNWEGLGTDAACGTCHGDGGTSVPQPGLSGAHNRHASTNVGGLGLACESCHGASSANMTHVNGNISWQLDHNNQKIGDGARYRNLSTGSTGDLAPSASYGSCTTFYCHSNVQGANGIGIPTVYQTPTWGSSTALTCSSCHSAMSSGAATGSHVVHAQTSGFACGVCHHDGGKNAETHADGLIYVNMTSTIGGTYSNAGRDAGSAVGYGTCSATACHGTVSPEWGTSSGKPKCEVCHGFRKTPWNAFNGATVTTDAKVGAHFNHISSTASAPRLTKPLSCRECHNDSIALPTDNIGAAGHMNNAGINKVVFGSLAGGGSYSAGTCSNVYCHGATLTGGVGGTSPVWNVPFLTGVASNDCVKCHAYPPLIPDHIKTQPSTYYGPTECLNCHTHVNASGTGFTDPSLHINGVIEGGDCISCHSAVKGARAAVVGQFASQSHHVQGEAISNAKCYNCHMEADALGTTTAYHGKSATSTVDLVIWSAGSRGTSYTAYTANGKRAQIAKLNSHCLGCHSSVNDAIAPFTAGSNPSKYAPEARLASPKPKTSILSRYSSTRVVAWSQYRYSSATGNVSRFGTNNKYSIKKALSAHGNAAKNQMMNWDTVNGEEAPMTSAASLDYTYAGTGSNRNVFCYDCHNSHGSDAAGITSSYSSATGRYKGGLLKSTVSGQGGYTVTYKPAARTITYRNVSSLGQAAVTTSSALFNSGASICNDCHNNDTRKVNISRPWSITGTYSSTKAIVGYWSTPYFDNYTVYPAKRTVYKAGGAVNGISDRRKPMGGHYGSSVSTRSAGHSGEVNGLCTPCHDPHGVSNALSTDRDHGVPLLKGTWVTSPYREDKADKIVKRGGGSNYTGMNNLGAIPGYHIDQNTFMAVPLPNSGGAATSTAKSNQRRQAFRNMSNTALKFHNDKTPAAHSGLCLECHSQTGLTGAATATTTQPWMSKNRVHQTVAGWGPTNGTNVSNKVHAYTCSKCHTPHVSRLPRLMVTNCLDVRHVGQVASGGTTIGGTAGGTAAANFGNVLQSYASSAYGAGRFPGGGSRYSGTPGSAQNPGPWWFQTNGATGTTQPTVPTYGSDCHNATNAGGTTYNPANQMWNRKTRW